MRRISLAVTGLLLVGALAACTKPDLPLVAVTQRGGRPAVILVTCAGVSSRVSVYRFDIDPGSPGYPDGSETAWGVHGVASTEIVEVVLFGDLPRGWAEDYAGPSVGSPVGPSAGASDQPSSQPLPPFRPLRELVSGVQYTASGNGVGWGAPVEFRTADLSQLTDGDVLTTDDQLHVRTATYDDFVQQARKQRAKCRAA